MKCEIEFLPVGEGSKAGDAIIVRYGEPNDYRLLLIDGGHASTGEQIVAHLKRNFGEQAQLEHVLLTHADIDHASGLRTVLQSIPVAALWLHVPWLLAEEARPLLKSKTWTQEGLLKHLRAEYDVVAEIFDLATAGGCKVYYPFAGYNIGPFRILAPRRDVYSYLLPQFDKTPEPDQVLIQNAGMWIGKQSWASKLVEQARAALQSWTEESWDTELLKDGGLTSASNEASVVLYGSFEMGNVLLTGDAGNNSLSWAAHEADRLGLPLQAFSFVQIPHHGSRRNVGPTVLNRLLGNPQKSTDALRFSAFVSAPKDDAQHPRRIVLNAFKRRGGKTIATQGTNKLYYGGFPQRPGYVTAEALPFFTEVEEYT